MAVDPRLVRAVDPRRVSTPTQPPPPPPPKSSESTLMGGLDGADERNESGLARDDEDFKLRFCTVCASNQNR